MGNPTSELKVFQYPVNLDFITSSKIWFALFLPHLYIKFGYALKRICRFWLTTFTSEKPMLLPTGATNTALFFFVYNKRYCI